METWDRVYEMYQKVGDLFICTINRIYTACPRSIYPFYIVCYYIKWVTTSWTYSISDDVIHSYR